MDTQGADGRYIDIYIYICISQILKHLNLWKQFEKCFDVFLVSQEHVALLQPHRACLFTPFFNLLAQKWFGRYGEAKTHVQNNFLERQVWQFCMVPKTGKRSPLLCIFVIGENCIFSHSLPGIPQCEKADKRTPLKSGGLDSKFCRTPTALQHSHRTASHLGAIR